MSWWVPFVLYVIWAALFLWVVFIARQVQKFSGRVAFLEALVCKSCGQRVHFVPAPNDDDDISW